VLAREDTNLPLAVVIVEPALRSPPVSLAKVINERLRSCMQIITLMLSAIIIYPSHQFVSVFPSDTSAPCDCNPYWLNAEMKPRIQAVLLAELGLSV
jgi:hypothetical protein